jgi:erythromycin esterase
LSRPNIDFLQNKVFSMKRTLSLFALFFYFLTSGQPKLAYNRGFEMAKGDSSFICWSVENMMGNYKFSHENRIVHGGRYAMLVSSDEAIRAANDLDVGSFAVTIPTKILKGRKKVKLDAWVKTQDHSTRAAIWFDQWSARGPLSQNSKVTDTVKTIMGWQHIQMEKTLDSAATGTYFGGWLNGKGKAFFDDFRLSIDGEPVKDTATSLALFTSSEQAWLNKNAVPLISVDSTIINKDLDSLSKWIGDASIVGIGEPTHGTSEVSRLRLRIFKYLVEQKGFNTYMIEDILPEMGLMNDYILDGRDTALNLLKKYFFGINNNEEMLSLVQWMRRYNMNHEKKIQFRGMDMQSPRIARVNIARFAKQYDTTLEKLSNTFDEVFTQQNANKDTATNSILKDSLKNYSKLIREHIDKNTSWYNTKATKDTVNWLRLNARVLEQYYLPYTPPLRDNYMAKNIYEYCLQYPDAKILIQAHNGHVGRSWGLGNHLNEYFGKNYFPIAFATAEGTYVARVNIEKKEYHIYDLQKPYAGTSEFFLQKANKPNYFLPLRSGTENPASAWLSDYRSFRQIGSVVMTEQFGQFILHSNFDALIFMKKTTHSDSFLLKKQ